MSPSLHTGGTFERNAMKNFLGRAVAGLIFTGIFSAASHAAATVGDDFKLNSGRLTGQPSTPTC
jgi:hypothetical protein